MTQKFARRNLTERGSMGSLLGSHRPPLNFFDPDQSQDPKSEAECILHAEDGID